MKVTWITALTVHEALFAEPKKTKQSPVHKEDQKFHIFDSSSKKCEVGTESGFSLGECKNKGLVSLNTETGDMTFDDRTIWLVYKENGIWNLILEKHPKSKEKLGRGPQQFPKTAPKLGIETVASKDGNSELLISRQMRLKIAFRFRNEMIEGGRIQMGNRGTYGT